jgi:exopolysaccharide production protein ExoQ
LLVTTTYSPSPTYSAIAVFSVVALYLACLALHADYDREMVLAVILASYLLVVVISLFAFFAIPSLGRLEEWQGGAQIQGHRLSGITGTPNGIGIISAWCALLIAIRWETLQRYLGRSVLCFGGIASLVALALSQSRTAMAILAVLTGLTFSLRRRTMPYLLIGGAIVVSIIVIFAVSDSSQFIKLLTRSGNPLELETGTGRAQIWSIVIKLAQLNFWTGRGYASTVFFLPDYSDYMGHAPPHAHNMWLQLWLTTGMIGVILFSLSFASQTFQAIVDKDGLSLTFLLFVMFDGITEPSAFSGVAHLSTLVLIIAAGRSIRCPSTSASRAIHASHRSAASLMLYRIVPERPRKL